MTIYHSKGHSTQIKLLKLRIFCCFVILLISPLTQFQCCNIGKAAEMLLFDARITLLRGATLQIPEHAWEDLLCSSAVTYICNI